MITLAWGAATSAGRVRSLNEDDYVAAPPIFVVADGMGGHSAGEVASSIAADEFHKLLGRGDLQPADVARAIERANDRIRLRSEQDASRAGMGTTLTGIAAVETAGQDHWMVFNVGDSRVYRYAGGVLRQLSVDHSEVEELVAAGSISRAEARVHPRRNVITRSLGTVTAPLPDSWLLPSSMGERFLVCSDGLVDEVTDDEICGYLDSGPPQAAADALVVAAVSAGGRDNVTVIVVEVLATTDADVDGDTLPRAWLVSS